MSSACYVPKSRKPVLTHHLIPHERKQEIAFQSSPAYFNPLKDGIWTLAFLVCACCVEKALMVLMFVIHSNVIGVVEKLSHYVTFWWKFNRNRKRDFHCSWSTIRMGCNLSFANYTANLFKDILLLIHHNLVGISNEGAIWVWRVDKSLSSSEMHNFDWTTGLDSHYHPFDTFLHSFKRQREIQFLPSYSFLSSVSEQSSSRSAYITNQTFELCYLWKLRNKESDGSEKFAHTIFEEQDFSPINPLQ